MVWKLRGLSFEAVIFDHDGTLVDTVTGDFLACRDLYSEFGVTLSQSSWASTVCGNVAAYSVLFDELATSSGRALSHEELRGRLELHWARHLVVPNVTLMEGTRDVLESLHRMGVPMAVATAATVAWVDQWLTHFELKHFFSGVSSGMECKKNKPDPEVYLRAAEALGVRPEACLVFEDSTTGVMAAKAAGMQAIAVPLSLARHLDFRLADAVITNLAEVLLDQGSSR